MLMQAGIKQQRDSFTLPDLQIRAIDENSRSVDISFSSESPVGRHYGTEILSHNADAVNFERINSGLAVALFNHDSSEIMGKITNAYLDETERKCKATIIFDADEDAEKIFQKVRTGTLKGISVGYCVDVWEELAAGVTSTDGRFVGPCEIATKWTPYEISFTSIPADASVGVGRDLNESEPETAGEDNTKQGAITMDEKQTEVPAVDAEQIRKGEQLRCTEITAICQRTGMDSTTYISDGSSVESVRKIALDKVIEENKPMEATRQIADVKDEYLDKFARAAGDAMALRYGIGLGKGVQAADGADQLRGMPIRQLMAEYLRATGVQDAHQLDVRELSKRALTPSSNFLAIVDNTLNKSMMNAAEAVGTTYQLWTGTTTVNDFKSVNMYRLSEAGALEKVQENGELKYTTATNDEKVSISVDTYGRMFGFTRQMIINDDMGYMMKIPAAYARAAFRQINATVYGILTTNGAIYDGYNLFGTEHANGVLSGGALPTVAGFNAMATAMGNQKDIAGQAFLNISPAFYISGHGASYEGQKILNSIADPTASGNAGVYNPWNGKMTPIVDAAITSTTAWYGACNPNINDTIVVGFLNGVNSPTIEQVDAGGEILGTAFRIFFDWGVSVADYRGLYYNKGAS